MYPVRTNERVPGHSDYYEKDGLRTYGDDEDHEHEPPVRTIPTAINKPYARAELRFRCPSRESCPLSPWPSFGPVPRFPSTSSVRFSVVVLDLDILI